MVRIIFISLYCCVCVTTYAQTFISGRVLDNENNMQISNVLVKIINPDSLSRETITYTATNNDGDYNVRFETGLTYIEIEFSLMGYKKETIRVKNESGTVNKQLTMAPFDLKEVTVKAPAITSRGDTINYIASSFITKTDRTVEDLLKKLPGLTIQKNGNIEYQGEQINKFYIEGLDMLGGKYNLATQNITAEQIQTVQVYENHQPVRILKDISISEKAAINITLKNNRMSFPKGNIVAGAGYSDEWQYKGELFGFMTNKQSQLLFSIKANNLTTNIGSELVSHYGSIEKNVKAGTLIDMFSVNVPSPIGERSGYLQNMISSINIIRKFDDYSAVKVNVSYQDGKIENTRNKSSVYYTGDEEIRIDENIFTEVTDKKIEGSINFEKNADNLYINETFGGNLNFGDNKMDILSSINNSQNYKMKQLNLNNNLNLIWNKGDNYYHINSIVTGGNIPENKLTIISSYKTEPIIQTISGFSIYTKHSTSFIKRLNTYSNLSIGLSFESEHDKINTNLMNNNEYFQNRNRGYKLTSTILPTYTYKKTNFNLTISSPVRYYNLNYKNKSEFVLNKPVVTPQFSANHRFSPALTAKISGGVDYSFGDILNFIEEPVQKSYIHILKGESGILAQNKSAQVSMGYDFRYVTLGLFSSFTIGYNKAERNIMRGVAISENGTTSAFSEGTKNFSDNIFVYFNLAKNFQDIKTILSLTTNYIHTENERLRQNNKVSYSNSILNVVPTIRFNPIEWMSLRTSGLINMISQKTSMGGRDDAYRINQFGADLEVSVLPFQNMEVYYNLNYNNNPLQENERENTCFMDCGIRYQPAKVIEIDLRLNNLTSKTNYTRTIYSELDRIETSYFIRPLGFILNIKVNY